MSRSTRLEDAPPVLVAGGGIGGLSAALALAREGFRVKVLEQSPSIGEIGAGIQLGPNAFAAFDALGVGESARGLAVYTDSMLMMDAVDGSTVASVDVGPAFRQRFGNPYGVIHRADVHGCLLEGVLQGARTAGHPIEFVTSSRVVGLQQHAGGVTLIDQNGVRHDGVAVIGADGVKSVIRQQLVGDPVRVSGHVVYRAVVDAADFPADLRWNAPTVWGGPNCHLVHYPLRHGEQYNLVVTFHSRQQETWKVAEGSADEVQSYFGGIQDKPRQLITLPNSWKRWSTADRDPIERWSFDRATLLGDAAHPMLQYLAQGACMAMEDAVTLGAALRALRVRQTGDFAAAFDLYQRARVTRTARVVLSAREMGRLYHAAGVERLVRNELWRGRCQSRYYDALEWLYGWRAENCLGTH